MDFAALLTQASAIEQVSDNFLSGDQPVSMTRFEPPEHKQYPAVFVVHGANGPITSYFAHYARIMAARGYVVLFPHYFERTGTVRADHSSAMQNFLLWMNVLRDGITFATHLSKVNPDQIALMGFSLGAYLSLSVASMDPRVRVVVDFFGGLPGQIGTKVKLPPTLILHGEADPVIPVAQAHRLRRICEENGITHEMHIFPGQGHTFDGPTMLNASMKTMTFLEKHL